MSFKVRVLILAIIMCFLMSESTKCSDQGYYSYYYKEYNGELVFAKNKIDISDKMEDNISVAINNLLINNQALCIPKDTKLLDVTIDGKIAILNFDENILLHGGNYYESVLLNQIFKNVLQFESIESIVILINGELVDFPEGHKIFNITELEEL